MSLPHDVSRCQGATAYAAGQRVLCAPFTDCQRRTDVPPDATVPWMPVPKFDRWFGCPMQIGPDDVVLVLE
jgi:hypothetical protein